jgi:hypothetical protein
MDILKYVQRVTSAALNAITNLGSVGGSALGQVGTFFKTLFGSK